MKLTTESHDLTHIAITSKPSLAWQSGYSSVFVPLHFSLVYLPWLTPSSFNKRQDSGYALWVGSLGILHHVLFLDTVVFIACWLEYSNWSSNCLLKCIIEPNCHYLHTPNHSYYSDSWCQGCEINSPCGKIIWVRVSSGYSYSQHFPFTQTIIILQASGPRACLIHDIISHFLFSNLCQDCFPSLAIWYKNLNTLSWWCHTREANLYLSRHSHNSCHAEVLHITSSSLYKKSWMMSLWFHTLIF